jgi:hypothetical protein
MAADRVIGLLLGLVAIAFGVNGVRIGKVLTKTMRAPWPGYFFRDKEPVAFWMTVGIWIGVGILIFAAVLIPKGLD